MEQVIWNKAINEPWTKLSGFVRSINEELGIVVGKTWVRERLVTWRWSYKKPLFFQPMKFTLINQARFVIYNCIIDTIPWDRLAFADEEHFNFKELERNRAVGPRSRRIRLQATNGLNDTINMSAMITARLDAPRNFVYQLRINTNDQWAFINFIRYLIDCNHLVAGMYLVVDNASIHHGIDSRDRLREILTTAGINIIFLPTYSPELNPIELCFAQIKGNIRENRSNMPNLLKIIVAAARLSLHNIIHYYDKCINRCGQSGKQ